jgi:hypothetical protein
MLLENQVLQLRFLRDIFEISRLCSTKTYVWGGLVMDIMEGRFLREHGDIDCFTLNLLEVKETIDELFVCRGYATEFVPGIDMYKVMNNGCHAVFNRLEIDKDTAMWRHIGDKGTLYFPRVWLKDTPMAFYDTSAYVSGIEFEFAIKAKVELLSPEWHLRETDKIALEYYTNALIQQNISSESVLNQVWSDNLCWREKGYKEY